MYLDFYIAKLLEEHECVIVPDFGAFITNERPPNINETEGKIYPASKRVAFNPSLTFNDGLLINSISFSEKISYNEASDLVKKLLEQWKKKLSDKESLLLVGIGELTLNEDQKLIFAPLLSNNFHPDSFGLSELEIKPVIRKLAELTSVENELSYRVIEPEEETFEVKHHHKTNKSRKVLYYSLTAYIPIIIGLWAVLFFTDPFNNSNESSLNPIEAKRKPASEAPVKSQKPPVEKTTQPEKIKPSQNVTTASVDNIKAASQGVLYVIGGSFKSYKNAAILQKEFQLKNYKSEIVKSANHQYRVAYSKFSNRSEAENFLLAIRQSDNKSAWILNEIK
jgi:nucleoid DNA-binding protein